MDAPLELAIAKSSVRDVQDCIFRLGQSRDAHGLVPDDTVFYLLGILRREESKASVTTGHLLQFFEFEFDRLSRRAKDRCAAFLREWGDDFSDAFAGHMVAQLRSMIA